MVVVPESVEDLVYFTKRNVGKGKIMAWVYRKPCPACGKALMTKPRDEKTGKPKIRAKEYVCSECNHTVEKQAYEDTLTCEVMYTCPSCNHKADAEVPFKRKKIKFFDEEAQKKVSVDAIPFPCGSCGEVLRITKKLK